MSEKILYTIGYGDSMPEDFVTRLEDADISVVLDVRRKGSKSWNRKYNHGSDASGMAMLLRNGGMLYGTWPVLGNPFDRLDAYVDYLSKDRQLANIEKLVRLVEERSDDVICLLCCERDAYKDDEVNCHRVYVADALVKLLGDGWEVCHL